MCSRKLLGVISFISQHLLSSVTGDQFLCLGDVVPLPSGQDDRKGLPKPSTLTWILVLNPPRLRPRAWQGCPRFLGRPRRAWVRPNHRAVNDQVFQVRVAGEMLKHLFPDAFVSPTGESFIDTVPIPVSPEAAAIGRRSG